MIQPFHLQRFLFFCFCILLTVSGVKAQQTVFSENFNAPGTPQNSSFTTAGPIGSSLWNVTRSGSDLGARIDGGMLTLTNDTSSSANFSGWVMASTSTSNYSSVYKSVLSQNSGVVSWTFNMRQIRTNPGGFAYGKYGVAFILAGTPGITNSAGKGYAVVLGQSTTTDPIRLATFSNGLASISPKLSSKATLGDFGAEYSSVRVEYNPANNKWTLYVRKDNATSFLDPKSGSLVYQDEAVITDFVSESLTTTGAFWNAGIVKSQTSFFDNISVSVQTPELVSLNPDSKIANTGAFTLTLNGNGFLPTSKVYWNGSSRTATFISSTQLTAAIPATDISLPGTAQITVGTGTYTSNALPFTIEPSGVPALMLSTTSLAAVSTVSGTASAPPGTYTINGANLVGDATVTAPANFEISRDGNTYASSLVLPYSGGILTGQPLTLRARLSSTAMPGNYSGNITHSTSGAVTKLVAVSGRVLAVKPTLNASGITFSNITSAGFKATWANGNGTQRLVLIKELSAVNSFPVDGVTYNANVAFGAGSQMGTGNYTVYKGTGNSVQISSLKPATAYYISVVEFNGGAAGTENYLSPGTAANTTTLNKPVGLQIRAVDTSYKINFDDTVDGVNLDTFQGFGMSAIVESGQLDSNAWAFSGFSSGAIAFGGNSMEDSSYENGISDGGEEDTGIYGFNVGTATSENYTLGIQPGGSGSTADFNPGTVTLRIQNQTGAVMTGLNVGYKVYIYNDQAASSKIGFSYGANPTGTYTDQPFVEVVSPATADLAPGWKAYYRVATITGLNVAKDAYYYLRWSGSLVSGSGAQDEFGIDDIEVIANSATNTVAFDGVAEDFVLQGNAGLSADLSVQRLLFNGGKLAIKDKTLTLTGDVVNSTANGLTGGVAAKLVIRGSRNPLLSFDQTIPGTTNIFDAFSILGTNGNTVAAANTFSVNTLLKIDEPKILNLGTNVIGGTLTSIQNNGLIQTQNTTATPFPANKTWGGTGILNLNASAVQTLVAGTYNNLKLSSAAGTVAGGNLSVNGTLDLPAPNASATKGSLDMGTFELAMGPDGTNTGVGEVTGMIRRNSFVTNKLYTFGHPNSSIIFPSGGTLPTSMGAKLIMGTAPTWRPSAIKRYYDITQTGAAATKAIIRQHYLDSELNTGNREEKLVFYGHKVAAGITFEQGKSSSNSTDNYVEISNANIAQYFTGTPGEVFISLDNTADPEMVTWNGSSSTSWTTITNWTPNLKPTNVTKVFIPVVPAGNFYPTLNPSEEIGSISIEAGATVNSAPDSQLFLNLGAGAWQNYGTFNAGTGTGKITFRNTDATVAGNTTFNNLEIASGAALRALENNVMRIEGTFTNNGTLQAGLVQNTIDYAKAGQSVPSPNSTTGGSYFNLKISGANTTVPANLNIRGNLTLDQYVDFTGKTVNMTGTVSQTIGGSAVINFNDLTVNKATEAVVLAQDIAVNGTLSLTSGNVMIDSKNLTLGTNAVAGTFGVNTMIVAQGTGMVRRAFTNTGSYLYPVGALTRTVSYSPVTVDVTAGSFSNAFVGVNVTNAKHPDNKSVRNYLRKYWNVQQTGITGAVATVNATYEASDIIGTEAAIASAQLTGTFNSSTNPWIKFGYLAGNKVSAANVILGEGQTSVFTGLQAGALSLEVYGYGNFCSGTAPTMNAVISGGDAPFTYEWSHGLGDTAAVAVPTTVVGITNYTLTVRDANGFVATDTTIPVEILPASVGGIIAADIQQICAGSLATDLQLNGSVGQVLYWQKSTDPNFGTFENLPNVTTTLTGEQIGPLTETTYFRAVIQNGGCAESRSSVAKVLIESTTWNGPVSGWSNGEPDSLKGMVFAADYMTAPNILTSACSCEVKSGATLTVVADSHITVQNGIVNNGNITVESDASVVQISNTAVNTGSVLVKRNLSFRNDERKEYNYLVSPVEGSNLKTDIYKNASGSAVSAPFALYHVESDNKFYNSSGAYVQGRALAVKEPLLSSGAVPTAFFQGKPFNGLLSYPLAYSGATMGYNLVGNPYPSNIDLNMLFADNSGQIETTFRFWDHTVNDVYVQQGNSYTGNAYAIFNAASGKAGTGVAAAGTQAAAGSDKVPSHIVKVGQGFMVKSVGTGKMLQYSNRIRLADNEDAVFYGKQAQDDRYWLKMTAPSGITSTIAVVYFEGGNNLFGPEDSRSLYSSDRIYSIVEAEKVAINGRAPFVKSDVIPLGSQQFVSGTHTISIGPKEGVFANGQNIYLKDKQTGTVTNLSAGSYSYYVNSGENSGRFDIIYEADAVLATDGAAIEALTVYRDQSDFVIKAATAKITEVQLFDAAGRLVHAVQPNSTKVVIPAALMVNGVYVLKINQNGRITSKKIIR